jgi:CO/xanthine dehydrogenase FAD-binding subunit
MSAAAQRRIALEAWIPGLTPAASAAGITAANVEALAPFDDIRASADGRRHAAQVLLRRALAGHPSAMTT